MSSSALHFIYFIFLETVLIGKSTSLYAKNTSGLDIIGGDTARAGQFPFAAAFYKETTTGRYFCGGALISNEWILTAGHCVEGGVRFNISLGLTNLTARNPTRVTVIANTSILHPKYNKDTYENDIGLIHLPNPVEFSDYISPIYLPSTDLQTEIKVISLGWGQTDDYHAGPVDNLNYVDVVTLSDQECRNAYGSRIKENIICVEGMYNQGTCTGDGGTPLVRYALNEIHPEHVGISSFQSFYGCESTDPSAYVKTYPYLKWIRTATLSKSINKAPVIRGLYLLIIILPCICFLNNWRFRGFDY